MALVNGNPTVRTGGAGAVVEARVSPVRARAVPITWTTSSPLVRLSGTDGRTRDRDGQLDGRPRGVGRRDGKGAQRVLRHGARLRGAGVQGDAGVLAPPVRVGGGGRAVVDYALDTDRYTDESDVTWYLCGDSGVRERRRRWRSAGAGMPATRLSVLPRVRRQVPGRRRAPETQHQRRGTRGGRHLTAGSCGVGRSGNGDRAGSAHVRRDANRRGGRRHVDGSWRLEGCHRRTPRRRLRHPRNICRRCRRLRA